MIPLAVVNKIKDSMIEKVKENFKKDGFIVPAAILFFEDGSGEAVDISFESSEERIQFASSLRKRCAKKKPIIVALVEEASSIKVTKGERSEYLDDNGNIKEDIIRPRDRKDAIDVIVVSFETPLTSEAVLIETKSVGGVHIIVETTRKGVISSGLFKDVLARPTNQN